MTDYEQADNLSPKIQGERRICMRGGYYKPKGRNVFRVWFPWHGRKIYINKYLDGTPIYSEGQAKRVLEKLRAEVDQGTFDPSLWNKDKTLQFQNAWDIYMTQKPVGEHRMEARERIYNVFLLPYFKDKSLKEIDQIHIYECLGRIPKTYAPSYQRVIQATLRALLTFHRVTKLKMFDFPVVKVPRKTPVWLSRIAQDKILSFIAPQHQPIFRFLMFYGCRVSESCNLKRPDVDWEKNIITFRQRKNDKENTIPIFDEIKSSLRPGKISHWEYIFSTIDGEKYSRQMLYRIWVDACKRSGEKVISLKNATRTSLICQWLNQGVPPVKVARMVGDAVTTILKYYAAISLDGIEEAHKISLQKII